MVSSHSELANAQRLLDDFNKKNGDFNGIGSLSEALGILSDLIFTSDDNQDRIVAENLVRTYRRKVIQQIKYAVTNSEEFTYGQLDYFDKVIDEFICNNLDYSQELLSLQEDLRKQRGNAAAVMTNRELIAYLRRLPLEERNTLLDSVFRSLLGNDK